MPLYLLPTPKKPVKHHARQRPASMTMAKPSPALMRKAPAHPVRVALDRAIEALMPSIRK